MPDQLGDLKQALAKEFSDLTPLKAKELGLCLHCRQPALARCRTDAGKREYQISALCEVCFDQITSEDYEPPLPFELQPEGCRLPGNLLFALRRYVRYQHPPGYFLLACLQNDLAAACQRADAQSIECLCEVMLFIYKLPERCWGDAEKVKRWLIAHEPARESER